MRASELLDAADDVLERTDAATAGLWPRVVGFLARQAIEEAMWEFWRLRSPGVEESSARAQLLCLSAYFADPRLAADVAHAWSALSRACHHHPYELAPGATELRDWLGVAREFAEHVERQVQSAAATR